MTAMPRVSSPPALFDPSTPWTGWRTAGRRYGFAVAYAATALVTVGAVALTAAGPGARSLERASRFGVTALSLNLAAIVVLAAVGARRVHGLFGERTSDAGVRLHRRFVGLFALAAVAPAVVVALFFGLLITRGVEDWFSVRVRGAVETSAQVARAYVDDQISGIQRRLTPIAQELNHAEPAFERGRLGFGRFLLAEMAVYDFDAVYLIDHEGRVLARAEQPGAPPYLVPPREMLRDQGADAPLRLDANDMARAVFRLRAYPDAFVYVVRPLGEGYIRQLRKSEASVLAYRDAERSRERIQAVFALSYVSTALLVLIGAVWLGVAAANQIATPVGRLVQAADRVAAGDLTARVPTGREPAEIAVLSRAFNRMTGDLDAQQEALRAAGEEARGRRDFIEAVLSGVSAGVIGLDRASAVSAINGRALGLLGLAGEVVLGRTLADAAPELVEVAERARRGADAETEVDVVRGADARRLRVRASAGPDAGLVLTFDDITRLLAAQRNAAWRDVARRIAHEIKNPLTPIQLSAERLRRKYRKEITADLETFDRCTDTIIRQVGDIGRMVDEFSAFARMPQPEFAAEDAAELVRQAVFAQRVAYPDVAVELAEPPPVPVWADGRMVGQALANVLKNAGEAVAARMTAEPGHPGRIDVRIELRPDLASIVVEDNGPGLPARDRDRLTEPYVTTREKGTGLGLAIVKRILEEHGGDLALGDASVLPGARAVLTLPRRAILAEAAAE